MTSTVADSSARWPSTVRAGASGTLARGHPQVRLPREHVERVGVDEAAVVVAQVDDDAVALVVLGVEIDVQLVERGRRSC